MDHAQFLGFLGDDEADNLTEWLSEVGYTIEELNNADNYYLHFL